MHREENVDDPQVLQNLCDTLSHISEKYKVIISTHPRTKKRLEQINVIQNNNLQFMKPFGFIDFLKLELNAFCIITDSGTVQEEATILSVPCILIRTSTERPELLESGGVFLSGVAKEDILDSFNIIIGSEKQDVYIPDDYKDNVSDKILKILMRHKNV